MDHISKKVELKLNESDKGDIDIISNYDKKKDTKKSSDEHLDNGRVQCMIILCF